jgi:hypothetical protein
VNMDLRVEDLVGDTSAVVRVGGLWRCAYVGGRWSVISVVLGEGGVLQHEYEYVTER